MKPHIRKDSMSKSMLGASVSAEGGIHEAFRRGKEWGLNCIQTGTTPVLRENPIHGPEILSRESIQDGAATTSPPREHPLLPELPLLPALGLRLQVPGQPLDPQHQPLILPQEPHHKPQGAAGRGREHDEGEPPHGLSEAL